MLKISFKKLFIFTVLLVAFGAAGCAESDYSSTASGEIVPFYYAEFEDVPIPVELKAGRDATTIYTATGLKVGIQSFSGSVEVGSLNSAMITYMTREGWTFRAALRAAKSVLVFEKPDRYCVINADDGTMTTDMQVFITPKVMQSLIPAAGAPVNKVTSGQAQRLSE